MPAKSLEFLSSLVHPGRIKSGDVEAPQSPEGSSNANSNPNGAEGVEQSDSEDDEVDNNIRDRMETQDKIGETNRRRSFTFSKPSLLIRFRSIPEKSPERSSEVPPSIDRNYSHLSDSTGSTDLSDFATPGPPKKRALWLQKIKDFIKQRGEFDDDVNLLPEYRWMPIFSGVCVPFSILLEIPGLTGSWFIRRESDQVVYTEPTPKLLEAGLAISMASAVVANLALIRRYMEYRPKAMTILAIVALSIHDLVNVLTLIIFALDKKAANGNGFQYGQSFWMTIGSTMISCFTNITLIYDFLTTKEFSKKGSGLTRKQRSLVIVVIILLCWIAIGAGVYSKLMSLSFINGLYFTVVSIETIGFGDISPTNSKSRIFSLFYNTLGILNFGLAVTTGRETIIESFEHSYRKRLGKLIDRRLIRKERRFRKETIKQALLDAGIQPFIYLDPTECKQGLSPPREDHHFFYQFKHSGLKAAQAATAHARSGKKPTLNVQALSPAQMDWVNKTVERRIQHERKLHTEFHAYPHMLQGEVSFEEMMEDLNTYGGTLKLLEGLGLAGSTAAMDAEQKSEFMVKLTVAWVLFLTFWLVGGAIFMVTEKWSYLTALYFCFVAFTTIGYGDLTPTTPAGRSIFVIWALLGVGTMTILISVLSEAYSSKYQSILKSNDFHRSVQAFRKKYARLDIVYKSDNEKSPTIIANNENTQFTPNSISISEKNENEKPPEIVQVQVNPAYGNREKEYHESSPSDLATSEPGAVTVHSTESENLPVELLQFAQEFQNHMLYFFNTNTAHPPPSLMSLLDDVLKAGETKTKRKADDKAKKEVLHDENGRKLLFMMSFEDTMRKMMAAVEHYHPFTEVSSSEVPEVRTTGKPLIVKPPVPPSHINAVASGSQISTEV